MPAKSPSPDSQDVKVTILLTGGHEHTAQMPPDAPLLRQLFEVLLDQQGNRNDTLFQIPIHKGRGILCFPGDRLVGLVTEPPVIVQQPEAVQAITPTPASPRSTSSESGVLPSDFIQLDNFLSQEQWQALIDYTLQKESAFVPTSTSTGDLDYRKSVVLHDFPEFANLISDRIREAFPKVATSLGLPHFAITQIEAQLTGHNDGNYYKIHNDNGSSETATRELTYVYYFYREPKAFAGGELRIYDSKIENNFYVQADSFHTVEPRNNSIVFFLSRYMHEVLPIQCPSRQFGDSRFTINGWVRR